MKAKHQKIKSIFLILILFLITTSPILLSALQKNFAIRVACVVTALPMEPKLKTISSIPIQPSYSCFWAATIWWGISAPVDTHCKKAEISLIGITLLFRKALLFSQISC